MEARLTGKLRRAQEKRVAEERAGNDAESSGEEDEGRAGAVGKGGGAVKGVKGAGRPHSGGFSRAMLLGLTGRSNGKGGGVEKKKKKRKRGAGGAGGDLGK